MNRGSRRLAATSVALIVALGLSGCGGGNAPASGEASPPETAAREPVTGQGLEKTSTLWRGYRDEIAAAIEPCDAALEAVSQYGLVRDDGMAEVGRKLSAACQGVGTRMLRLQEPPSAVGEARVALREWVSAQAALADQRTELGKVIVRFANRDVFDEDASENRDRIVELMDKDRVDMSALGGHLARAVEMAGSDPASAPGG